MCCYLSKITITDSSQGTITLIFFAYVEYLLSFLKAQLTRLTVYSNSLHLTSDLVKYLERKATGFSISPFIYVTASKPVLPSTEGYTKNSPLGSPCINFSC